LAWVRNVEGAREEHVRTPSRSKTALSTALPQHQPAGPPCAAGAMTAVLQ
jgi:hypothetical protein